MNDFNMVNVESQSQVGKSVDTTKLMSLKMDIREHNEFLPVLKELQNTSNKVVKDFHQYLSKREKKTASLPYNMIKKFQMLKGQFYSSSKVLNFQNHVYSTQVSNRDFDKMHEQLFFKKTMKSYDEKRLWMKNYILRNEAMVQTVEEVVKQNVDYEVHQFTQFRNQLNIERLQHNYEGKLQEGHRCMSLIRKNIELRQQIKKKLAKKIENLKEKSLDAHPLSKLQENKQSQQKNSNTKAISLNSFLNYYITKQYIHNEFLKEQAARLKSINKKLGHNNQQLKLAIDKAQQRQQFSNSQAAIIYQHILHQTKQKWCDVEQLSIKQGKKLTKTDYLIYLKEIQRHCQQTLKLYGFYFVYSLSNVQFPNAFKSKSASKCYPLKSESPQIQHYHSESLKKDFMAYREANKDRIMKEKQSREEQRKLEYERRQLVLNSLQVSAMKQDSPISHIQEQNSQEKIGENKQNKVSIHQPQQSVQIPVISDIKQASKEQLQLQEEEFQDI